MRTETQRHLVGFSYAVFLFLLSINMSGAVPLSNTTTTGCDEHSSAECAREGKKFTESESCPEPDLAAKYLSYGAISSRPAVCNRAIYGNCLVPFRKGSRPCGYYERCRQGHPWRNPKSEATDDIYLAPDLKNYVYFTLKKNDKL